METNTSSEHIDSHERAASDRAAQPQRRRRIGRALIILVLLLSSVATVNAVPAHAMEIGPTSARVPGTSYSEVVCTRGRLTVSAYANVQQGWYYGQYVRWQYHLQNDRGYQGTSGWSSATPVAYNNYNYARVTQPAYLSASLSTRWWVHVRVEHWNGSHWVRSNWQPASYASYTGASVGSCHT